jgi:tRNA-specific 2-thiouridylase
MGPGAVKETHIQNNRILMAMSGGVDSSAAALMLKEQGREVVGVTMLLHDGYDPDDARAVAEKLGIEFHVLDLRREFKETIIDQFVSKYKQGLTPNPCVDCNREIKFGLLWENALKLGCRAMATGHYARIGCRGSEARLLKANYAAKDQSYFLHVIPKELLDHIYFPLGEIEDKEETRKIAAAAGLFTASKSDSQDICFVPDGDYMKVIEEEHHFARDFSRGSDNSPERNGVFLDTKGNILGHHEGHVKYTIGQRRGLGVASADGRLYVLDKDAESNTVILGRNEELFKREVLATDMNWMIWENLPSEFRCRARIRYRHKEQPCSVMMISKDECSDSCNGAEIKITFDEPQRAVTPGQAVVLYDNDRVLGGGTITGN